MFVDLTQLTNLNPEAVCNLMPKLFAQWKCKPEIGKNEAPWIDHKWIALLWQYLQTHFTRTLYKMEDLHIVPLASDCSRMLRLSKQLAVISRTTTTIPPSRFGSAWPNELATVCDKLGIYIINDLQPELQKHPQFLDNYAFLPTAKGMLQALSRVLSVEGEAYVVEKVRECTDKVRCCLRAFLAKDISSLSVSESDRNLLRILPIFMTIDGSGRENARPVSLTEVTIAAPSLREGKIPVPSPKVLLNLEDESSKCLAAACGVKQKSVATVVAEVYFLGVKSHWYSAEEVITFMKYFCENFTQLQQNYCSIELLGKEIKFVQKADGSCVRPRDVFDEGDKVVALLFSGDAAFPAGEFAKPKYRHALTAMGLRNSSSVTALEMHATAVKISSDNLPAGTKKKVANAFVRLLNERSDLLRSQLFQEQGSPTLRDELISLPCIPIMCKRVDSQRYPQSLAFYGEVSDEYAKPAEVKAAKFVDLVGSVRPLVDTQGLAVLAKVYGWNDEPNIEDVKEHLMNITDCYNCEQKVQFLNVICSIYRFLNEHKHHGKYFVGALTHRKWIWNGESFSHHSEVVLCKDSFDLQPYRFTLPAELNQFSQLWTECGLKRRSDLTEVLQAVSDTHERGDDLEQRRVEHDIQLCVNILNFLAKQEGRYLEHLLVPVNTESGKLQMKPATECTYVDKEWYQHDFDLEDLKADVFLVHELVPLKTAEQLKIPSLISRTLGVVELDIGFGQSEPLTRRLNAILRDYTDGLAVLKELIQNSDDAGASEVCFLYDERCNENARNILLDRGMKDLQGPALWTYNNAVFTDTDFENIVKLSGATKEKDGEKIGRFGLGFNAIYHLTDVPSFISRGNIVFFDPHTTYLGRAITNKGKPGIKLNLETHRHKIQRFTDQFKPYNGLFGCDLSKDSTMKSYEGTLFRFPLRTKEQAMKSEISSQHYSDTEMMKLLGLLETAAHHILLYTQNVQLIKVFHLAATATSTQETTLWLSVERSLVKVLRNVMSPTKTVSKHTRKSTTTSNALPNVLQQCNLLMKNCKEKYLTESPFCELSVIYNITVNYGNAADMKFAGKASNSSDSYWLVVSCSGRKTSLELARHDSSLVPVGGAAAQLERIDESNFKAVDIQFGLQSVGVVYCFLPLPIQFNLPVHINGYFALHSSRTHLHERVAMDKEDKRAIWNEALMSDAVCQAYCILIEDLTRCSQTTSYNIWPVANSLKEIGHLATQLYQSLYCRVCTDENCAVIKADDGWVSLNRCRLLRPDFRREKIAELALRVLRITANEPNKIVDIPEAIVNTIVGVESCRSFMQQKFIDKRSFFEHWFLPNVREVDALTRDTLVLSCLFDENLKNLLTDVECIPVSPNGEDLKTISELVHPDCKLAELYDADEGCFPLWTSGVADNDDKRRCIHDALVKLGMKKHDLSWESIADRCSVIQSNPSTAAKRTKVLISLMGSNLAKKLNISEHVAERIRRTKFLPVMKQPADFPIRWKSDESVLVSSKEGYLIDKKYLVCCSYPLIDQACFGAECKNVKQTLGLFDKKVELTTAVNQICELQKAAAEENVTNHQHSIAVFNDVYSEVFCFLNNAVSKLNTHEKTVLSELATTNCVLVDKTLLMLPSRCAVTSTHRSLSLLPYLAVIEPTAVTQYGQVLKAIGVKDSFTLTDYVWILREVEARARGRELNADEMELVISVINQCIDTECRKPDPVMMPMEDLPVPNAANWLCPANSLCYNNCPWLITPKDINCCHQGITYPATVSIGIKTIRQDIMKRHRLALPFGQKERLVKRIKRIIESYPFSEDILKEMLQNADDAGATKVHFIRDTRQLETEKVFDETWKAIQGPALCVYNDKSFTDKDLQGIQLLGEGSKSDDPVKTGHYGVGFNCVYHLTDVPTFLTTVDGKGTVLCAFDPNCKYVPDADARDPGGLFRVTGYLEANFRDVLSGYFTKQYDTSKNGTMFRLPLRTQDMAKDSEIEQKTVTAEEIRSLFTKFKLDMYEALLFVNSVEEICLREVITGSAETVQLQDAYSVHVRVTEDAKTKRNFLQSKMQKAAVKLRKKEKKLCDVEMTEVVYELTTEDSDNKRDTWLLVQRLGFEDTFPIPKIVSDAYHCGDLGRLPLGGVAYLKQPSSTGSTSVKPNRLFCFLPLPLQLPELPVHVNGHFVLSSESRRGLWTDEHKSFKSEWNRCIMEGVVAPAYCTLIRTLKNCLRNRDSDYNSVQEAKAELDKFHSVFPNITRGPVPYETSLTTAVYRYIGAENLDVLPVRSSTKQLRNVKWMGPLGQPNKKVYFDDLESQMKTPDIKRQFPQTVFRSSGPIGCHTPAAGQELTTAHLKQALVRCGFLLFACPLRLCKNFEKAQVPVQRIKPEALLDFFASHNQHPTQCKLGSVPCRLSETPLNEINFLEVLLKYCCRATNYKQRLDGLPLLLTKSLTLTTFNSHDRKYVTEYSDVAPTAPDMFMHSSISNVLQLNPMEDTNLCQQFDVTEFSMLLPGILDGSDYCGSEKTVNISTLEELLQAHNIGSTWLAKVWSFFASFVPSSPLPVQQDKANTETILIPVAKWCLLPVSCGNREILVPICQSSAVLYLTQETSVEVVDILKTLKAAKVNWKYITRTPHQLHFMKPLLGNIHQPQCVVMALRNRLQQSTLEGSLSKDKGLRLLAYFSENVTNLRNDDETKNVISQLPFFVSMYNTQISINRARTYVLPGAGLPGDDMEIWRRELNVTFLLQLSSIEKLVEYLGCKCLTVVEAYTMFIFSDFDKLSPAGQTVHIGFVRDYLRQRKLACNERAKSEITMLTKALKTLAFLPSLQIDGSLVTASSYYDIEQEVFKVMLPNDAFPPPPYRDLAWRDFLLDCGIIHEVTEDMFVEFATTVESKVTEEVEDGARQQSKILLKHFLQRNDLHLSSFLDRIKSISFIEPVEVGMDLQNLHAQHGIRDVKGRLQFICLQHSVLLSGNKELIWTTKNILPPCVNEQALKTDKDQHHRSVNVLQQLQVIVEPSPDDVAQHVHKLCTFVVNEATILRDETIATTLENALKCVYTFLMKHSPLQESVVSVLSDMPFVCVRESCRLVRPSQFATDILEEHEIKPYLNKFPLSLGNFADLFLKLGTTKTPTAYQYASVLEAIHDKTGQRKLLPDESKAISTALKGMFALMLRDTQASLSVPECVFFPSRSDNLLLSSDVVYVDDERLLVRLKGFQKPLLVDLKPICGLTNEEDISKVLQKLPADQQPTSLSSVVKEYLDDGCEDADSDIANELRNRLASVEFRSGVERIARHCLANESLTQESLKLSIQNICSQVQKIRIMGKSEIKTYLECEGQRIANSERSCPFFHECIFEDGNSVSLIYVQRNPGNLPNLHCHVAKVIHKAAENRLLAGLQMLTLIIGCSLQEIDEVLTDNEIIKLNAAIKQFNPPVGSHVPESKHCFLVQNVFVFEIGMLVALEVDDPLDRNERGGAKYKLVEIMERLRTDSECAMADRYRVKVSNDGQEQIVDATLLYAFSRDGVSDDILEQDDDGEYARSSMIALRPPGSEDEPPPEPGMPSDFRGIAKSLKRELKEAWALPEEQRRRVVKRLRFQWHPDKHPPEKKSLMTKVFQFLQNLVERLEQGRPIDDVDEEEAPHSSRTRHADDFMGERARRYRQYQNNYRHDTGHFPHNFGRSRHGGFRHSNYRDQYADFFSDFHPPPNPQPAEAERWMQQAKYDLEAAEHDEAPEWACYKCYQVKTPSTCIIIGLFITGCFLSLYSRLTAGDDLRKSVLTSLYSSFTSTYIVGTREFVFSLGIGTSCLLNVVFIV